MSRLRVVVSVVLLLALGLAGSPAFAGGATTMQASYVGTAWIAPLCHEDWPQGVGGACFELPAGTTRATGRIDDASGFETTGYVVFRNASGPLSSGFFCLAFDLPVPAGATHVNVNVQDPAIAASQWCGVTAATTGLITVTFR